MADPKVSSSTPLAELDAMRSADASPNFANKPVVVPTPDGACDALLVWSLDRCPRPAVIMYPDVVGLRPVKIEMAQRLAAAGFVVLVVNQFYRVRAAPLFDDQFSMATPSHFSAAMQLLSTLDDGMVERDSAAFVQFLSAQPEVIADSPLGAIGFCMGGAMAIRTAATAGERVGCVVSMHGGNLVNDRPDSPHRLLSKTSAAYYIGVAGDDDAKRPGDKGLLADALVAAGLEGEVEVYPDGNHGWMVPGARAYSKTPAERGWSKLIATVNRALS